MTRDEYEQRLESLEQEIAALRLKAVEPQKPPHPRWMPKEDELYYTILGYGEISGWLHHNIDDNKGAIWRSSIDNVFRTEAEAEFAVERLKVLAEMREWTGNWNDPWYLRFFDGNIAVNERILTTMNLGELRFACKDDAENCIRVVGKDRLIKYYFGVRDHEIPDETE